MRIFLVCLAILFATPAVADGMPIHADDPWARAIGDTRTLENDHIGCATQDNATLVRSIQRNTLGVSMDLPQRCLLFFRGQEVVVVNLEYGFQSCGDRGYSCAMIWAQIHLVGDQRRYWLDAPVELFEVRRQGQ
jgi:hypothetical protein